MSARSFRSVGWVAGIAATALGCYMVNLKVASERAALEDVETRIVLAERDIRLLQTEIGTRGRLAQLERWNVKVLALSAPGANQFMEGSFQLATLAAPKKVLDPAAPVVLASAPAPARRPVVVDDGAVAPIAGSGGATPAQLMHVASLKREIAPANAGPEAIPGPAPSSTAVAKLPKAAKAAPAPKARAAEQKTAEPKAAKATSTKPPSTKPVAAKVAPAKPKLAALKDPVVKTATTRKANPKEAKAKQ